MAWYPHSTPVFVEAALPYKNRYIFKFPDHVPIMQYSLTSVRVYQGDLYGDLYGRLQEWTRVTLQKE